MIQCPQCKKIYEPELGARLKDDRCIQDQYPEAKAYQREQLKTGICSDKCWDAYLGVGKGVVNDYNEIMCCGNCNHADGGACQYAGEISDWYYCSKWKEVPMD